MAEMLTLEAFEEASEKVREVTLETKLVESPHFSAQTGNRVWLKPENMQRTGAYKVRGAYYKISTLSPRGAGTRHRHRERRQPRPGCCLCRHPRRRALRGGDARDHAAHQGRAHQALRGGGRAARRRLRRGVRRGAAAGRAGGLHLHPPRSTTRASPPARGTIAMEVVQELPLVDTILVPVGGGGLACGVATFAKLYNPQDPRDRRGARGRALAHGPPSRRAAP